MQPTTIIFDFDETLAQTKEFLVKYYNQIAPKLNLTQAGDGLIQKAKNIPPRELIKQAGISLWKIPIVSFYVKYKMWFAMESIQPKPGLVDFLIGIKSMNLKTGILSSNSKTNIEKFLKIHQIKPYFDFVCSQSSLFGKHKTLEKILQKYNLSPNQVIYVGDEVRDIIACKKVKIPIIALTAGLNSAELLNRFDPEYTANNWDEVRVILQNLVFK